MTAATRPPLLLQALRDPDMLRACTPADWDVLLRQAASANLMAALWHLVERHGLLAELPGYAREQLAWADMLGRRHRQAVLWEVRLIAQALAGLGLPLILLKGAAYRVAGLRCADGRLFSDIDILVPEARLAEVEAALMLNGWASAHQDDYDQRYYRLWMHELPPMQHMWRSTVIDVHHAILPKTAALRPDPALLRAAAVPLAGQPGMQVLAPADMLLHSAVHLFHDGEFKHGLRDLLDIDALLSEFGPQPQFWARLPQRALELQLQRPLFYALRYCQRLLGTAVPEAVTAALRPAGPGPLLLMLMDALFDRALLPEHPSCDDGFSAGARFLLYLRGNWLRMPALLLVRHLLHKALLSPRKEETPAVHLR
ncbi:nucleotidyltransferase family protein [Rugamonas sp.]|uniref:nucleotidyltransferase domain-containing protein n=1 Tax=Rugamonas sp. TaxID=1926287 RepID=UPI0025FD6224|nr:nucleotidyltransferase family protein [Rugamonas sp.]